MRIIKMLILAVWLFACGGTPEDLQMELDALEQEVTARPTYGVVTGGSPNEGRQCTNVAGQTCVVPNNKIASFRCSGFAAGAETNLCNSFIDAHVQALISQFPDWEFGRVSSGETVLIVKQNLADSGTATLDTFLLASFTTQAALAESPAQPATFRKLTKATVNVDWAAIDAKFTGTSVTRNKSHLVEAAMGFGVGLGLTEASFTRSNSVLFTADEKLPDYRAADICRVNAYDPSGSTITISGSC